MLPLWLWGYVLLAGALASGLQTSLPDTVTGLIGMTIAIGVGGYLITRLAPGSYHARPGLRGAWRAAAFAPQPRSEDLRPELITTIESELDRARLTRDDDRRDALALIRASLRAAEMELRRPLSEDEELQVLQRKREKRVQAFQAFEAIGRQKQADKEAYQLDLLEEFMPEPAPTYCSTGATHASRSPSLRR